MTVKGDSFESTHSVLTHPGSSQPRRLPAQDWDRSLCLAKVCVEMRARRTLEVLRSGRDEAAQAR